MRRQPGEAERLQVLCSRSFRGDRHHCHCSVAVFDHGRNGVGHVDDCLRSLADRARRNHFIRQCIDRGDAVLILKADIDARAVAGLSTQLWLAPPGQKTEKAPTSVSLSDQGLVQVLEASVTGLEPGKPYVLALSNEASGAGVLEPLQGFMANAAGSAVVNAIGPIRQIVRDRDKSQRRYLVIAPGIVGNLGAPVQVQTE